jgi:putative membrane protein
MMGYYYGYDNFPLFGGFMMIVFWIFIVWGIVQLIRMLLGAGTYKHYQHRESAPDKALAILKERYAKGEIDQAEFVAKKKDLEMD